MVDPLSLFEEESVDSIKERRVARQKEKEAASTPAVEAKSEVKVSDLILEAKKRREEREKLEPKKEVPKDDEESPETPKERLFKPITIKTDKTPQPATQTPQKPVERGEMATWDKEFEFCVNGEMGEYRCDGKLVRSFPIKSRVEEPTQEKQKRKKKNEQSTDVSSE